MLPLRATENTRSGPVQLFTKLFFCELPKRPACEKLPRRWVAERTFAWIGHNRLMSKDYERRCSAGEAFIHAAMTRLMARRLARS